MQAGDKLHFVKPFDVQNLSMGLSGNEILAQRTTFAAIMRALVFDVPQRVHSFDILEQSGFVTVFEASYRLDASDGSYLHILAFGFQNDGGLLEAGISLVEHSRDGADRGGYMYRYDVGGVRRTTIPLDEATAHDQSEYFSLARTYKVLSELEDAERSDDLGEKAAADAARADLEAGFQFEEVIAAAGYDDQPPYSGELEQLADLIRDAYHFPLEEHRAA